MLPREQQPDVCSPWRSVLGVARELGVGPRTIYHAIQRGELRAAPVNERGDLRIHVDWIAEWMARRAERASPSLRQVG